MEYDQIILDLLNRVIKLEIEVAHLKAISEEQNLSHPGNTQCSHRLREQRDKTRYLFNGNVYLKNRLVLAVVTEYANEHSNITRDQLKNVFDKSLQGSMGVVENAECAIRRSDYVVRFFTKGDEILHLADGDMYVCSQWGILNIVNFISRAKRLGYEIEAIK